MFDKRLVCTGVALVAVVAVALFVAKTPHEPPTTVEMLETVSGVEKSEAPPAASQAQESGYLLKTHNGRLAVFLPGKVEPEMELDVLVKYLPDYDRALLEQGIQVDDYSALVSLIEDYSS